MNPKARRQERRAAKRERKDERRIRKGKAPRGQKGQKKGGLIKRILHKVCSFFPLIGAGGVGRAFGKGRNVR